MMSTMLARACRPLAAPARARYPARPRAVRRVSLASSAAVDDGAPAAADATGDDAAPRKLAKYEKPPRPPPHFLRPPNPPPTPETWQNMVLLIDKPKGWTSFDVVGKTRWLSRRMGSKKVGHCGTLDPNATGLLILCIGKATKMVDSFTGMDKVYTGTMKLGEGTPSQDCCEEVDERAPWEHVTDADLVAGAKAMEGDITQIPPMFSAIKVKGERLYKAARRGETVERKERQCTINSFEVWRDVSDPQLAHFRVDCSKGTYVRTLAFDLGKSLGTTAHLTELRRESIGEHSVQDAWTVESLFEACEPQVEDFLAAKEKAAQEAEKEAEK